MADNIKDLSSASEQASSQLPLFAQYVPRSGIVLTLHVFQMALQTTEVSLALIRSTPPSPKLALLETYERTDQINFSEYANTYQILTPSFI